MPCRSWWWRRPPLLLQKNKSPPFRHLKRLCLPRLLRCLPRRPQARLRVLCLRTAVHLWCLPGLVGQKDLQHRDRIGRTVLALNVAARLEKRIQLVRPKRRSRLPLEPLQKMITRLSASARCRLQARTGLQDVRMRPLTLHRPTAARERGRDPETAARDHLPAKHRRQPPGSQASRQQPLGPQLRHRLCPAPPRLVPCQAKRPPIHRSLPRHPRPPLLARRCLP